MRSDPHIEKNVGQVDRVIRLIIGAALVVWPVVAGWPVWMVAIVAAIGGIQIHTGIVRY